MSIKKGLHLKGTKYEIPYLLRDKRFLAGSIVILSIILAGFSPYIFSIPFPKTGECFPPNQPPSSKHILGVDLYGRDWFRLLLYSIMPSLYTGVLAGLVGSFIGILIGLGPPYLVSLGYMIWVCQRGGYYGKGWWFFMPPILLVVVIFVGLYLINLAIESLSNPRLRKL